MDIDFILTTMNTCRVQYLLIGGMNFALRHKPYTTYDVDLWIADTDANITACEQALAMLSAEWGRADDDWGPTRDKPAGWLRRQGVFSLNTPHGPIDIFRSLPGLTAWEASFSESVLERTIAGTPYHGLSDADMLRSQLALDKTQQKADRIRILQQHIDPKANP